MADTELDKTIEELEAEVMAELEEGMHDAPKKSAVPAEPMKKAKNGEMQDTGSAVVSPTQGDAPAKKVAGAAKEVSGDPAQKGEGKPQKMSKPKPAGQNKSLAAEGYTDEEIRELCHSKDHDCATVVEHPVWGKGKPVHGSHALPTDDGYVEWYDVQFKHGVEEKVMAEDMKIVVSEAHHEDMDKKPEDMTKTELMAAMNGMMKQMNKKKKDDMVGMVNAMYQKMGGHLPTEGAHEDEDDEEEKKMKKEAVERRIKEVDVSEHVDALMNNEGDLSEEFKRKAATVFEAAVKSKIRDEVSRLEDEYKSELDESIKTTKEELSEKVDTYLNYVVEEWMKENELAIERGLKGEIAEDFISGLKTLFEDHYVDIPDEKYDVLEAQSEKITELEKKLNEEMGKVIDLKNSNSTLVREQVISETTTDLTDTEIEKFKSLTEDVEFTDGESFKEKLDTLKESYFPKTKPVETKTVNDVETGTAQDIDTTDSMASYMKAIGKLDK